MYDELAGVYDGLFQDVDSLKENIEVIAKLGHTPCESVLDVGCGTGLLLDYVDMPVECYTGIDPSGPMLDVLKRKHPAYAGRVHQVRFEDYTGPQVDLVVSLFGVASYIDPLHVRRLVDYVRPGGRWFVMFYRDGYHPVVCERSGVELGHYHGNRRHLAGTGEGFNNFVIVTGQR